MIQKIIKATCIWLITTLRPLLGSPGCCCFAVSCSRFAIMQLQEKKLIVALWNIFCRLAQCNPVYMKLMYLKKYR